MKTKLFLLACAALFVFSCKKNDTVPGQTSREQINAFQENNAGQSQTFTVDVSNGSATITADQGTVVFIPEDAFLLNGQPVSGQITIEVKEILRKSDIVISGVTTVSNGQILDSGGEIFINATSGGQQLSIDPDTFLIIGVPKDSAVGTNGNMMLFAGEGNGDNFDWKPVQQDSVWAGGQGGDTAFFAPTSPFFMYDNFFCSCYSATKYFTSISTLGWQNIDCFYSNPGTVKSISVLSPGFDKTNSSLFVVLKNKKSAINVYADIAFHSGYYDLSLPDNEEITVVAIGAKDGKMYFDMKDYTVSNGMVISLNMIETSEADITGQIEGKF